MGSIDWKSIKTEYISSDISIRELAEKHGISLSTVKSRSSKEGWVEARKQFQTDVDTKVNQKVEEQSARRRARAIIKAQQTAIKIGSVLSKVASKTDQFYMHIVQETCDGSSEAVCREFDKPDTRAIRDCTAALKDLTACIRELFGDMGSMQAGDSEESYTGVVELPSTLEEDE